eukprot:7048703-Pyramimonas_sp.AAC.1
MTARSEPVFSRSGAAGVPVLRYVHADMAPHPQARTCRPRRVVIIVQLKQEGRGSPFRLFQRAV